MAEANLGLQVIPLLAEENVYSVVDQVIDLIRSSGLEFIVGPMETTMEGDLDELLELVRQAQRICVAAGASRVLSVVKIDYKPEGVTMEEKVCKYRG